MPPRRASAGEWTVRSLPRTTMRPASGRTAQVRILTRVLLPAPLAPMSACTSPGRTDSEADFSATTAPYVFETPVASRRRSVVGIIGLLGCLDRDARDAGGAGVPR